MISQSCPVTLACDILGCAQSSYYYKSEQPDNTELKAAIGRTAGEWSTYGYRRITAQLRRQRWCANHKRVRRLIQEMGLQVRIKPRRFQKTDNEHCFPRCPNLVQGLEIVRPDQVWVSGIIYIRLRCDFVYLAVIMDVYTRCIRG